ncbi:flagellin [Pseudoalteromonas ruthenica]|uniref:flagellin N-terminal helical domain-containing protein n=1 Tax=Pseudoalteromonas ruthenica TaxID=151081 RepID=UPI0003489C33|nr:flagellin [Pseudoalteromonas ruthenica]
MKINSQNSEQQLQSTLSSIRNQDQQLATGKRVNSAADDAAALQIIDRLTAQQNGFTQASRNAYDGISYAQVSESALSNVNDSVGRIRELSIQAGNGALSDSDRQALQEEVVQLQSEITNTLEQSSFAGKPLFDGQSVSFQVGADANQTNALEQPNSDFLSAVNAIDITTQAGANSALDVTEQAAEQVNQQRAQLGAFENSLSSQIRSLSEQNENVAASQSRIADTDYAKAVSERTSNDILNQASIALRGQANQNAAAILGLL